MSGNRNRYIQSLLIQGSSIIFFSLKLDNNVENKYLTARHIIEFSFNGSSLPYNKLMCRRCSDFIVCGIKIKIYRSKTFQTDSVTVFLQLLLQYSTAEMNSYHE